MLHAITALAFMLVAFTPHAATGGATVRFWTMQLSPHHDAYIKGVIADFERQHPGIHVKWVDVPWAEMEKKTLTAVAAASARNPPPDVVNLNPQFASKLAEFGALADPERYLSRDEVAAFLPQVWNANRLDGRAFALPWYLTTNIVLVNQKLLREAKVRVPETHDALLDAARDIRRVTGRYAYFPALDGSIPLETLVAMGAPLLSDDRCRAGFIDARGARVLSWHQSLYRENLVPKNVVTEGHRKAVEMFLAGQVAMITSGMQFLESVRINNASLYPDVTVAPQFGKGQSAPNIAMMNVAVLEASTQKEAAFRFAAFLTNAKNQTAFAKRVPILPSTSASLDDPFFVASTGDAVLDTARRLSVAQVREGRILVPPMRKYNRFRADYARNLQAVMLNRKSVDTALSDMDRTWQDLLGCGLVSPRNNRGAQ